MEKIWKARIHERHRLLIWKIGVGAVAVRSKLQVLGRDIPLVYRLCDKVAETVEHLFC